MGSIIYDYNATVTETFQVPAGVNSLIIEAWGGGGGGGVRAGIGGGGGGGGAYARKIASVRPGQTLTCYVGYGGGGGLGPAEPSWVSYAPDTYFVYAVGGDSGELNTPGAGGASGSCTGDYVSSGGAGGSPYGVTDAGGGGGGAGYWNGSSASDGGDGGNADTSEPYTAGVGGSSVGSGGAGALYESGNPGLKPDDNTGGGGGGGGGADTSYGGDGAVCGGGGGGGEFNNDITGVEPAGGNGQVKISWTDPINILVNVVSNA